MVVEMKHWSCIINIDNKLQNKMYIFDTLQSVFPKILNNNLAQIQSFMIIFIPKTCDKKQNNTFNFKFLKSTATISLILYIHSFVPLTPYLHLLATCLLHAWV
jgi:hypothetical protein